MHTSERADGNYYFPRYLIPTIVYLVPCDCYVTEWVRIALTCSTFYTSVAPNEKLEKTVPTNTVDPRSYNIFFIVTIHSSSWKYFENVKKSHRSIPVTLYKIFDT